MKLGKLALSFLAFLSSSVAHAQYGYAPEHENEKVSVQEVQITPMVVVEFAPPQPHKAVVEVAEEVKEDPIEELVRVVETYARERESLSLTDEPLYQYVKTAYESAIQYEIDPLWVLAMIWQESRFKPESKSGKGAIGIMQIMPSTGEEYGATKEDLLDPKTNISVGVSYLNDLKEDYNLDLRMATIAYNQGIGNVRRGKYRTWYYTDVREHYDNMMEIKNRGGTNHYGDL